MRVLFSFTFVMAFSSQLFGADVEKIVVTCVNRQSATNDDIYLKIVVDGKELEFEDNDQRGTSSQNVKALTNGEELILNEETRKKLTFGSTVELSIWERDQSNPDERFGKVVMKANETKTKKFTGGRGFRKYQYRVAWKTTP